MCWNNRKSELSSGYSLILYLFEEYPTYRNHRFSPTFLTRTKWALYFVANMIFFLSNYSWDDPIYPFIKSNQFKERGTYLPCLGSLLSVCTRLCAYLSHAINHRL